MKERFLSSDETSTADISFRDHELLEILLYFSKPRVNTNETAHLLLQEFGSLRGVFQASAASLLHVEGVGISTVFLIRLITAIFRRVISDRHNRRNDFRMAELRDLLPLIRSFYFLKMTDEQIYMMLFDPNGGLIKTIRISDGTQNSVPIDIPRCVQQASLNKAADVVLVHNHPACVPPSQDDLEITDLLVEAFNGTGITFLEHLIYTENLCFGLLHNTVYASEYTDDRILSGHEQG